MQQELHERLLYEREKELKAREMELLHRELYFMIRRTPTPHKRKGRFKRSRLKILKKEPGQNISFPSDFRHTITVQQTMDTVPTISLPNSPATAAIPRFRAIACKYFQSPILNRIRNNCLIFENSIT